VICFSSSPAFDRRCPFTSPLEECTRARWVWDRPRCLFPIRLSAAPPLIFPRLHHGRPPFSHIWYRRIVLETSTPYCLFFFTPAVSSLCSPSCLSSYSYPGPRFISDFLLTRESSNSFSFSPYEYALPLPVRALPPEEDLFSGAGCIVRVSSTLIDSEVP